MVRSIAKIFASALLIALLAGAPARAQEGRKVKSKVLPELPEIARQMNLRGTVRLEVEIAADGTVKSTRALGGHPLLIQSAERAVRNWRFVPGPASKTVIEFDFTRKDGSRQ